mmetsp:Transcript_16258/g.67261  ORF Transcript_16258/g.67261 Transcript_16258/m.67261 type:complete len:120 (+) Transcript_16258:2598-2957(+)
MNCLCRDETVMRSFRLRKRKPLKDEDEWVLNILLKAVSRGGPKSRCRFLHARLRQLGHDPARFQSRENLVPSQNKRTASTRQESFVRIAKRENDVMGVDDTGTRPLGRTKPTKDLVCLY